MNPTGRGPSLCVRLQCLILFVTHETFRRVRSVAKLMFECRSWAESECYVQHNYSWFCSVFLFMCQWWLIVNFVSYLIYPLRPDWSEGALGPLLWEGEPIKWLTCRPTWFAKTCIQSYIWLVEPNTTRPRLRFGAGLSAIREVKLWHVQKNDSVFIVFIMIFSQHWLSSVSQQLRSMMQPSTFGRWWWVAPSAGRSGTPRDAQRRRTFAGKVMENPWKSWK